MTPSLFTNQIVKMDSGLGTTYERCALNQYLIGLHKRMGIATVLEGPGDGMTGITGLNSLILARNGVDVTLVLPNKSLVDFAQQVWTQYVPQGHLKTIVGQDFSQIPDEEQFDLVWNFNVMSREQDHLGLLQKMCRLSRQFVMVIIPNRENYSFFLHRLHHRVAKQEWDHGNIDLMQPGVWKKLFETLGYRPIETVWVDCPWWPDIVDIRQMISDFFPFLKSASTSTRLQTGYKWQADCLPYYDLDSFPEIHRNIQRLFYFENSQFTWVKMRFAHHTGILAQRIR